MLEIIIAVAAFAAGYFVRPVVDKYRAEKRAKTLGGGGPPNLWEHFRPEHQALAWNALSALVVSALLYIIWSRYKSPLLTAVVSWFLYEESLVAICSTW